jgi:hypothetical protein
MGNHLAVSRSRRAIAAPHSRSVRRREMWMHQSGEEGEEGDYGLGAYFVLLLVLLVGP